MAVLYRKYRPQTFSDVLGQKYIIQTLQNQVKSGSLAHAYLFTGSRGVGKTSIARILAKAVNCLGSGKLVRQPGDACGKCGVCKAVEQGNFLDLVEIDAASNTGVDNIRELIEHVKFSPSVGKYKVFIIDEVHMLSKGAFNALLKTLEEPPKHVVFILATTEINKVPATIISRTQRFDFKRLETEDLVKHLEKILKQEKVKLGKDILALVAQNAEGSGRDALSLLDKVLTLGEDAGLEDTQHLLGVTDIALSQELISLIQQGNAAAVPDFFDRTQEKGVDYAAFNRDFLEYGRKLLVTKVTGGKEVFSLQDKNFKILQEQAAAFPVNDIIFIIRLFLKSYKDLGSSPAPQLPMLLASLEAALKKTAIPNPIQSAVAPRVESNTASEVIGSVTHTKPKADPLPALETHEEQNVNVTMEEVQKFWPKVIAKLRTENASLSNLIKNSPIQEISGGRVVVGVKFAFHKQNLDNSKNYSLISKIIKETFGQPVGLKAVLIKDDHPAVNTTVALTDALKIFGGELIE